MQGLNALLRIKVNANLIRPLTDGAPRIRAKDPRQGSAPSIGTKVPVKDPRLRQSADIWFIAGDRQCDAPHIIPRPPPIGFPHGYQELRSDNPSPFGEIIRGKEFAMKKLVLTIAAVAALAAAASAPAEARGLRLHGLGGVGGAGAAVAIAAAATAAAVAADTYGYGPYGYYGVPAYGYGVPVAVGPRFAY
jgi:hypothetical protein